MTLSNPAKIALVTVTPVVVFTLLFTLAILFRRHRARSQGKRSMLTGTSPSGALVDDTGIPCETCQEKLQVISVASSSTGAHLVPRQITESPQTERRASISEPHFAEKTVTMRRVSSNPAVSEAIHHVNSVASSMQSGISATSDRLPWGGRKSTSGDELSYDTVRGNSEGAVIVEQRRLSILNDPGQSGMNMRRVSIGGEEDVILVRSASQSIQVERVDQNPYFEQSEPMEILPTPTFSPHYPSNFPRTASMSGTVSANSVTAESLQKVSPRKGSRRPDSIVLAMKNSPATTFSKQASLATPQTTTSNQAIKSPASPASFEGETTTGIFEAWKGFPPVNVATSQPRSKLSAQLPPTGIIPAVPSSPAVSPPPPSLNTEDPEAKMDLPLFAAAIYSTTSPDLNHRREAGAASAEIPQNDSKPELLSTPTVVVATLASPRVEPLLAVPMEGPEIHVITPLSPKETNEVSATSKGIPTLSVNTVDMSSDQLTPNSSATTLVPGTPNALSSLVNSPKSAKITYLADVVKEDERRKSLLSVHSANEKNSQRGSVVSVSSDKRLSICEGHVELK